MTRNAALTVLLPGARIAPTKSTCTWGHRRLENSGTKGLSRCSIVVGRVRIITSLWRTGDDRTLPLLPLTKWTKSSIEKPFEKANKGTDLKVTFQPPEEMDRIVRTALQGGEGPDVIMTPGPAYAQEYIDANLFAELDEYSDQYKWDDKLRGWAIDLGRYEDKLYSIPYQLQTMLLYYNKTLLQDKGMQPPKSRDELESMAEELQGEGIT